MATVLKPRDVYMPTFAAAPSVAMPLHPHHHKFNAALTLPQLNPKPHPHHSHHTSGLSSGVHSLSHSMRGRGYKTTFPPLVISENPSVKVLTQFPIVMHSLVHSLTH